MFTRIFSAKKSTEKHDKNDIRPQSEQQHSYIKREFIRLFVQQRFQSIQATSVMQIIIRRPGKNCWVHKR